MTTLSENDELHTSKYTKIEITAPRIDDREMLEELQKLIDKIGVKRLTIALKDINKTLEDKKIRVNLKFDLND